MNADDPIWWTPDAELLVDKRGRRVIGPAHVCATAVLCCRTVRGALDPAGVGRCRYCLEPLPECNPGLLPDEAGYVPGCCGDPGDCHCRAGDA